jgi:hypothetical protein
MEIQAHIPLALCTLHNFIHEEDPNIFYEDYDADIPEIFHADYVNREAAADIVQGNDAQGELADGLPSSADSSCNVGGLHCPVSEKGKGPL